MSHLKNLGLFPLSAAPFSSRNKERYHKVRLVRQLVLGTQELHCILEEQLLTLATFEFEVVGTKKSSLKGQS